MPRTENGHAWAAKIPKKQKGKNRKGGNHKKWRLACEEYRSRENCVTYVFRNAVTHVFRNDVASVFFIKRKVC